MRYIGNNFGRCARRHAGESPIPPAASLGILAIIASVAAWAHEGHKALPTKGARVEGDTVYLSAEAKQALGLSTAELDLRTLERTVTATAVVVTPWHQHAFVTTKLAGKVERVFGAPGDFVTEGQKLTELESLDLENEQIELIQYHLDLELAQQTLERAESLGTRGVVAEREVRAAQTTRVEKSSAVAVARRKLLGLGIPDQQLDTVLETETPVRRLTVLSPMTGVLVHSDANPGRVVEPTDHLFEIVDLSTVWVQAMVVESETYRLKLGQPVRVYLAGLPGQLFEGKIDSIALEADAASRAVPVRVELQNPDPRKPVIRPGMFGRVEIVTQQASHRLACPTAALVTAGAETYVFVQQKPPSRDRPGEYLKRNVVLGLRSRDWVEVQEGLFPGDLVVLQGSHELSSFFVQGVLTLTLEAQRNIRLELEPVGRHAIEDVVTVHGVVEVPPDRKAVASSRVTGKIARILVDQGEPVHAGQVVAEVESLEFQEIQLEAIQTKARRDQLKRLWDSARSLNTVIAQQEALQRETEFRKADAQLRGLERKLQAIGVAESDIAAVIERDTLLESLPVRSPIDGHMVRFDVIPGQVVKAEMPLFELHDMRRVSVRGFVFEKDLAKVRVDQTVRIRIVADPNYLAEATLARTSSVLSTERVLSVWADLDNPDRALKDNMLARMTIAAGASAPVPAVPLAAVLQEGSDAYVFVKKPDRTDYFDRRAVKLGRRDDRYVEVVQGLEAGELVAIGGVHELRTAYASIR